MTVVFVADPSLGNVSPLYAEMPHHSLALVICARQGQRAVNHGLTCCRLPLQQLADVSLYADPQLQRGGEYRSADPSGVLDDHLLTVRLTSKICFASEMWIWNVCKRSYVQL